MMNRKYSFPFFLLMFSLSCAEVQAPDLKIYQAVPQGSSLLSYSEFKVIDDFNSGDPKLKNRLGAVWESLDPERVQLRIDRKDPRQTSGRSLKASFALKPGEEARFESSLGRLDISSAQAFAFKCSLQTDTEPWFDGQIWLSLTDSQGKTTSHEVSTTCSSLFSDWGEVVLPISKLKPIDLNKLTNMEIRFSSSSPIKGNFWIDEVAFYGTQNLDFESHKDNLIGFPEVVLAAQRQAELIAETNDQALLLEIAKDTWKYFQYARDKNTQLIVDHLKVGEGPLAADYTSNTNIAMDLLATVAAEEFGFISRKEAVKRIKVVFATLHKMERWKGFFYNYYETSKLAVTRRFVSSVDSGWLAISLVVVRSAYAKELGKEASRFLDEFDFEEFLDPGNNQLSLGFDEEKGDLSENHYGLLASEARATSFYAIGKGDISRDHWWFIYRTPPESWKWQNQIPKGKTVTIEDVDVFEGYYTYQNRKVVPSWGGSLFEFLMPTLVMREAALAPEGLGLNNRIATEIQRDYALKEKGYPVWGISPAAISNGKQWRYAELGVKALSVKGYPDQKAATPHVSFLALDSLPEDAIKNIRKLLEYNMYGEYGFYDSLNLRNLKPVYQYLALDQGMTLVALCNYLKGGAIQKRFHDDPVGQSAEDLLMKESFFKA